MSDLISRQTVIDMVKGWKLNQHIMNEEDALDDVNALPSAEPERKKGKWIDSRDVSWMCSECGKWLDVLQGDVDMNFCPNCGADMRKREGNNV